MLVHRLRRWPNIDPTLVQCRVFVGMRPVCFLRLSFSVWPATGARTMLADEDRRGPDHVV